MCAVEKALNKVTLVTEDCCLLERLIFFFFSEEGGGGGGAVDLSLKMNTVLGSVLPKAISFCPPGVLADWCDLVGVCFHVHYTLAGWKHCPL